VYEAGVVSTPYCLQLAELAAAAAAVAAAAAAAVVAAAVGLQHNLLLLHQPQDSLRVEHVQPLMFCAQNITQIGGVSDPDRIRIQSCQWIRIRICIRNPDPDPGGQKLPTKVEKIRNVMF
jgi:hypothetical protein